MRRATVSGLGTASAAGEEDGDIKEDIKSERSGPIAALRTSAFHHQAKPGRISDDRERRRDGELGRNRRPLEAPLIVLQSAGAPCMHMLNC